MDSRLCRLYLEAMGVRVWQSRRAAPGGAPRPPVGEAAVDREPVPPGGVSLPPPVPSQVGATPRLAGERVVSVSHPGSAEAVAAMDWEHLQEAVVACRACALCETRNRTVFGVGDHNARLMIVGEAPGADEDRQGEPFVGRAGQLLDRMLAAIGLARGEVFIANILKCRPPGNRDPQPEEAERCAPFLMRQVALVRPAVLLAVGRVSAQSLLATDTPVGRLRGRWFELGPERIPLLVTYHPSYLLRSPEQKARAWQDLLKVAQRLRGATGPPRNRAGDKGHNTPSGIPINR